MATIQAVEVTVPPITRARRLIVVAWTFGSMVSTLLALQSDQNGLRLNKTELIVYRESR